MYVCMHASIWEQFDLHYIKSRRKSKVENEWNLRQVVNLKRTAGLQSCIMRHGKYLLFICYARSNDENATWLLAEYLRRKDWLDGGDVGETNNKEEIQEGKKTIQTLSSQIHFFSIAMSM